MYFLFLGLIVQANPPTDPRLRPSSYPYISGDTFRAFSKHIYDETTGYLNPKAVKHGDTIFVNGDILENFFNTYHREIDQQYILIVHNTDCSLPGNQCAHFLDDPKLIVMFVQNMDRNHPKLKGLPIGLANYHWPHGKTQLVSSMRSRGVLLEREVINKAYLNFLVDTNASIRRPIWDFFVSQSFCMPAQRRTHAQYLEDMHHCRFVISPRGNGIDCHRHWEALLMGSIPVMKRSSIDYLFEDLPVILVDDWSQVNEQFLEKEYAALMSKNFKYEKLYAQYWFDIIQSYQNNFQAR